MFIEAKDDGGGGDNWTTGAVSHAKLQSNHQPPTNQQWTSSFLQAGCPSCHPTNSVKALKGKHHIPWTCSPQAHLGGLPTLSLTTNSSLLLRRRVAMPLISPLMPVHQHWQSEIYKTQLMKIFYLSWLVLLLAPFAMSASSSSETTISIPSSPLRTQQDSTHTHIHCQLPLIHSRTAQIHTYTVNCLSYTAGQHIYTHTLSTASHRQQDSSHTHIHCELPLTTQLWTFCTVHHVSEKVGYFYVYDNFGKSRPNSHQIFTIKFRKKTCTESWN